MNKMRLRTIDMKSPYIDVLLTLLCLCLLIFAGTGFGVIFFCAGCISFMILRRVDWRKHVMLRRILLVCLGLGVVSFLIIESFVISGFGVDDQDVLDVDYVVVLGAGLKGTEVSATLQQRLDESVKYASDHKDIPIIVSGGQGPGEDIPEAVAMRDYMVSKGIAADRIVLESNSTSTQENLLFTRNILESQGMKTPKILIVTSDYHMFRAELIARKLGYTAYGISSPSPIHLKPINLIREYFAMIKTMITLKDSNA